MEPTKTQDKTATDETPPPFTEVAADEHVHGPGCNHDHHHHHHGPSEPFVRAEPKVGRNDPCPCGSGKKFKKCCG